ncbi:hypothetical protein PA25_16860 [Pseudoalteromonas sp. A25]|uniref:sensor histidine kinase n=1 Tax=Pseudoalteromonas sp. A25 TaxID=116092 RepID=UPI001260A8AF|nr:HAMP domain-containing sensor histidine kinase [Pseudoalteromonas sp. A25]BBN81701.1 hypothetical protein PA25_16860 [Pseudoalteromonas sp. A25]
MKIRISLRIYVLVAMLLTGGTSIILLSALSMHYFATGMDVAMRGGMYAQAQQYSVMEGVPITSQQYIIAARWEDLPANITTHFSAADIPLNTLRKHMIGGTWFTPPSAGFFVMKVQNTTQTLYVASTFNPDDRMLMISPEIPHFIVIIATAVGAIFAFTVILIVVLKKITTPVERLKKWARRLDKANLNEPLPDFQFSELNSLANMMKDSLRCVQQSVEREQKFLAYASHELRTPIATICANSELLKRLLKDDFPKDKQLIGLERIERAALTMSALTETLLWLNRDSNMTVTISDVSLSKLIRELAAQLSYLIKDKAVKVRIETDQFICPLPETVCRIILNNIIRNAYVHTNEGNVIIIQSGLEVSITNVDNSPSGEASELGFGLGLELTERLTHQYQWHYVSKKTQSGRQVHIQFA